MVLGGGDGTCRAVAKGCEQVPLVAVSTGTNNVFPVMVEGGTIAGLAAGVVATTDAGGVIRPAKSWMFTALRAGGIWRWWTRW